MLPDLRLFIAALFVTIAFVFIGFALMATMKSAQVTTVMQPAPRSPFAEAPSSAVFGPGVETRVSDTVLPSVDVSRPAMQPRDLAAEAQPGHRPPEQDRSDARTATAGSESAPPAAAESPTPILPSPATALKAGDAQANEVPSIKTLIDTAETTSSIGDTNAPVAASVKPTERKANQAARRSRARSVKRHRSRPKPAVQQRYDSGPFSNFFQPTQTPTR